MVSLLIQEDRLSLPEVAQALGLSERTLHNRLKEQGLTLSKVIEEVRCRMGIGYLQDSAISLAEVAAMVGFSDQSSFTKVFRRATGMSPSEYRRFVMS